MEQYVKSLDSSCNAIGLAKMSSYMLLYALI